MKRVLCLVPMFAAVALFASASAFAVEKRTEDKNVDFHEGKVVSVTKTALVMTDPDGKNEHKMTVADSAKLSCDGKECKLSDLQPGQRIRVWTSKDNKDEVTRIDALDKNKDFGKSDKPEKTDK